MVQTFTESLDVMASTDGGTLSLDRFFVIGGEALDHC